MMGILADLVVIYDYFEKKFRLRSLIYIFKEDIQFYSYKRKILSK